MAEKWTAELVMLKWHVAQDTCTGPHRAWMLPSVRRGLIDNGWDGGVPVKDLLEAVGYTVTADDAAEIERDARIGVEHLSTIVRRVLGE